MKRWTLIVRIIGDRGTGQYHFDLLFMQYFQRLKKERQKYIYIVLGRDKSCFEKKPHTLILENSSLKLV
jgi:hypothetical protein